MAALQPDGVVLDTPSALEDTAKKVLLQGIGDFQKSLPGAARNFTVPSAVGGDALSTRSFFYAFVLNIGLAFLLLLLFSCLRTRYAWCYEPRVKEELRKERSVSRPRLPAAPPRARRSLFGWIASSLSATEEEVFLTAGLDATMMLRVLKIGAQLFAAFSVASGVLLIPANMMGGVLEGSKVWSFDGMSLTNVPPESDLLWGHFFVSVLLSVVLYGLLWRTWGDYIKLKHRHQEREQLAGRALTVMVEGVGRFRDNDEFEKFWAGMYDSVDNANICQEIPQLEKLLRRREIAEHRVTHAAAAEQKARLSSRPAAEVQEELRQRGMALQREVVELDRLDDELAAEQQRPHANGPLGFVRFTSPTDATHAAHMTHSVHPGEVLTSTPPEARDLIWSNVIVTSHSRDVRRVLVNAVEFVLIVFWLVPVAVVSAMTTLEAVSEAWPWLKPLLDVSPNFNHMLQGWLPAVVLALFVLVIPYTLRELLSLVGYRARSIEDFALLRHYFLFQVLNVFLVSVLAGSIFDQMSALIERPLQIVDVLGQSVPRVAGFFINYVSFRCLAGFPLQLLQPWRLLSGSVRRRLAATDEEQTEAEAPPDCPYGFYYPEHLLIFIVGFTYATIAPIVLPFTALYFALAYLTMRQQYLYVIVPSFETGGRYWPVVFSRMLMALGVAQLTLVGLFGTKRSPVLAGLAMAMPVVTYIFYRKAVNAFRPLVVALPAEAAQRSFKCRNEQSAVVTCTGGNTPNEQASQTGGFSWGRSVSAGSKKNRNSVLDDDDDDDDIKQALLDRLEAEKAEQFAYWQPALLAKKTDLRQLLQSARKRVAQ